jgi:hypothetical protein
VFVVYKPEGQPEQRWHFLPGRLRTAEMIAIEKRAGVKYGQQFKQDLMMGGTSARQALLWTLLRREHHTIRFEDVDFADDELLLVLDKDETLAEIEALESFDGITEAERLSGLALLRQQLADAPEAPGKAPAATPAAPGPVPPADPQLPAGPVPPPAQTPTTPDQNPPVPVAAPTVPADLAASNGYATSTGWASSSS